MITIGINQRLVSCYHCEKPARDGLLLVLAREDIIQGSARSDGRQRKVLLRTGVDLVTEIG